MPDYGHTQHHIDMATAINAAHGSGLDTVIDATPVDWGEGWVHPTDGSDSYDGSTRQTPKATIGAAISAGFSVIHVGAGTHNWTGTSGSVSLIHHPGIHTYGNAPVTCTGNIGLLGLTPPPQHVDTTAGSAVIKGSGSPTDIFRFDQSVGQRWGGVVRNLKFDASTFTRSAVHTLNNNMIDVDYNVIYSSSWVTDCYLVYAVQEAIAQVQDNSWSRVTRNTAVGAALLYTYPGYGWDNRWNIKGNRGYSRGGADTTNPFVYMEGGNDQGHAITDNSFEGNGPGGVDNTPMIYLPGKHQFLHVAGNAFEHTDTTDHVSMQFGTSAGDVANSTILASVGYTAANGYVKINGTTYSDAYFSDPTANTYKNLISIAGKYFSW